MEQDATTEPGEIALFQRQLGVLVDDADYCLEASRERRTSPQLHQILVPVVTALLYDTLEVLEDLLPSLGNVDQDLYGELEIDPFVEGLEEQTRRHLEATESITGDDEALLILRRCNRASGETKSSLIELEHRLSELTGTMPSLSVAREVEHGLTLRRLFARFDRALVGLEPLENRFVLAGRLFQNMIESKSWKDVRAVDQLQFIELSERLGEVQIGVETPQAGDLWKAIRLFSAELRLISRRRELRRHDRLLVEAILNDITATSITAGIDEDFIARVEPLRFVTDDIDELFRRGTAATIGEWKFQLETVRDRIDSDTESRRQKTAEFVAVSD